jgi:hypothetical protein
MMLHQWRIGPTVPIPCLRASATDVGIHFELILASEHNAHAKQRLHCALARGVCLPRREIRSSSADLIFHHRERRSDLHIRVCSLACHLLTAIEKHCSTKGSAPLGRTCVTASKPIVSGPSCSPPTAVHVCAAAYRREELDSNRGLRFHPLAPAVLDCFASAQLSSAQLSSERLAMTLDVAQARKGRALAPVAWLCRIP